MSERKLASVKAILAIDPIEGADAIEVATIDGWKCVVAKKDGFKVGDKVCYFEIDSILDPENPAFAFMEPRHFRVRTIRLRGQLSQGLVMPLSLFDEKKQFEVGDDLTEALKISKFEPYIPAHLSGVVRGNFPSFLRKTDEERVQNLPDFLANYAGTECFVTEKCDGTSMTAFLFEGEFGVASRNMELKESEGNLYWQMARKLDLEAKLQGMHLITGGTHFCIQGEIIGQGVQGNKYKLPDNKLLVFNIFDIDNQEYLDYEGFIAACELMGLDTVPIIDENFVLNNNTDELLAMADGKSAVTPDVLREGLVFRAKKNRVVRGLGRFSFKAVSNKFLLKFEE
jgi:RNA ligase (TIGR02306 family)